MNRFIETITSGDPGIRDVSFAALCESMTSEALLAACAELEAFRRATENLYSRVRATLFLYATYRFHLRESPDFHGGPVVPPAGFNDLLERRFEEAIDCFIGVIDGEGPSPALFSALAEAYHQLAFQTLSDQVRRCVRSSRGNQWMFRVGHVEDHPVRIRREMRERVPGSHLYPILCETTPVRLDLSHSGWSDIFFLGMDYPEGARVINISVDLGVYGRDTETRCPIETYVRVIDDPVLRITSIDLEATKDVVELADLFNFGNDYLSLLKAGVIASGVIPPSFEGTHHTIAEVMGRLIGPGMGLEVVTKVNDIPKGSRLAVSTNLLASIISALMRASGQTQTLEGPLNSDERRLAASRAILGEWLGGSGGGWQDSGGIWPGIKIIEGALATEGDPEFGVSKGRLLPNHRLLGSEDLHPEIGQRIADSLILFHGGMAQNVGPILEMVTEKYLLRAQVEWRARHDMRGIFDGILEALKAGDVKALGAHTHANWTGPLKAIIPWVTNKFTESVIAQCQEALGEDFWGFLMLGGMSGGGMGLFVSPDRRNAFRDTLLDVLQRTKNELHDAMPFAMDPVLYDFRINPVGSGAAMRRGDDALMPTPYYALQVPQLDKANPGGITYLRRVELERFTAQLNKGEDSHRFLRTLVGNLFRVSGAAAEDERRQWAAEAQKIRDEYGFDSVQHEQMRDDLNGGRIGLSRNRLAVDTLIEDVEEGDVTRAYSADTRARGEKALREGRVAVLTLAGGVGTRWTKGAGVVKGVNPFVKMGEGHRSFLEIHLAKSTRCAHEFGADFPHLISTSFLTHEPIRNHLRLSDNYGFSGPLYLSPGRSISQRLIPMVRDLTFLWEEMSQETLDEQKQKVRDALRDTLMKWASGEGEGSDYTDNFPNQCLSPPGHWYEVPNLLRNGVLRRVLTEHPHLETIMLHNIDTLGANLDPRFLGAHLESGNVFSFEVVERRIEDRGGGLARVNGHVRLLEGLAQPREEDELRLSYYNSLTTWIHIDGFLDLFGLTRDDLHSGQEQIDEAVRAMAARMPTYLTIKDVKRRWGHGQEDVYPVAQFEKLWGDMTALPGVSCGYLAVPRLRGQQLKDPAQLDAWANDGSKSYLGSLCEFAATTDA